MKLDIEEEIKNFRIRYKRLRRRSRSSYSKRKKEKWRIRSVNGSKRRNNGVKRNKFVL